MFGTLAGNKLLVTLTVLAGSRISIYFAVRCVLLSVLRVPPVLEVKAPN